MKIYIAHNYAAGPMLLGVVTTLERYGHTITSTWITDPAKTRESDQGSALLDCADIDRADALLFFTDQVGNTPGRGKWFELGYAYAKGKIIYAYGIETGCVFLNLPNVHRLQVGSVVGSVIPSEVA